MNLLTKTIVALFYSTYVVLAQGTNQSIDVDVRTVTGTVNRQIFGNNILGYQKSIKYTSAEYWDRGAGIWNPEAKNSDPQMVLLAKLAGLSVARYPGGGAVQHFDWKKTIGPVAQRPDQKFGLPEFLQFCSDIGAVPLITLADYSGTAQDAADLVEYLNAPDDGKHPWAQKRKEDGHSQPWSVFWFEYGNETHFGDGEKKMGAQEYANNYLEYQRVMKQVDPRIKLGAVGSTEFPKLYTWLRPVVQITGKNTDFVIHHSYLPSYNNNDGIPNAKILFATALAGDAQIQSYYDEMNQALLELTGKKIPIAVTEYNGLFVQEKPVPYRLTLGNALVNAEMIRVFLNPANNIIMANSWQFSNEYWGAVKGYSYMNQAIVKRPLFYVFQLYHEHFGTQLIKADVQCDTYETEGGYDIEPTKGAARNFQLMPGTVSLPEQWQFGTGSNFSQQMNGNNLLVDFKGEDVNYYHASKTFDSDPTVSYRATGWIKTVALTSANGVCIEFSDSRGWNKTKSAKSTLAITGTTDWQKVEVDYTPLPDTKKIDIRARRMSGGGPISGRAYFRDISVQKFMPQVFPAVPYLSVNASNTFTENQKKVYLMVVNKNMDFTIKTRVNINGMTVTKAKAWILNGPSVDATNENDPRTVSIKEVDFGKVTNGFIVEFPPHSLTSLEVE
ncbi:MAG: alpha-L-arabinofuranosidase C-terminal domain-containing protein [Bacteroidota bacterium]